ncbi:probable receptor-like serine/threonine-protein kinase At5g57670 [Phragmites australis]|uniref:probable receptor-like serine/threonine-protein kinase At5g57670 n=1 Tax=Phragmites australis TaxID=29695 RepID=UPI002D7891AA|nr:probable receptor-like serine/threonine-protein kinase At5g57670 [Phragmites australis]
MKPLSLRGSGSFKKLLLSVGHRSAAKPAAPDADAKEATPEPESPQKPAWRCFSYDEVHRATNSFHKGNLVGRGGSSEVYRGDLPDGHAVAVKRLMGASACERRERDFLAELGTVGHARHPNVCGLLGCCVDRDLYLVFEFSHRGSVSANLHDEASPAMGWAARHGIAVGTARGLEYLHKGCQRRIIHRDINASNVLLTEDFQPQISDFGLAKWLPSEWTHRAIAPIEGTFGCLAPEYYTHGIVDEKTDVFAFGVLLLELMTGRKPVDGSHRSLLGWARPLLNDGKIEALVDPRIGNEYDGEQARRVAFVASLCIRASATWRPSMTEVLALLEGAEIWQDRWAMPEAAADDEEPWGLDDLDDEDDDEDEEFNTPSPSSCSSATTSN